MRVMARPIAADVVPPAELDRLAESERDAPEDAMLERRRT